MEHNKQRLPEVIDAEYTEHVKGKDTITPKIEQRTQLVPDTKGNRMIWMAILIGILSMIVFLLTFFL